MLKFSEELRGTVDLSTVVLFTRCVTVSNLFTHLQPLQPFYTFNQSFDTMITF